MDDGQDVTPEGEPEQQPCHQRKQGAALLLLPPADGEHERPGAERQHLDVVAVVAQAVVRDVGGSERRVEARGHGRRCVAGEQAEPVDGAHEERVEEDRDQGEGPGGIDDRGEGRGEVGFEAAAVRHAGDEDVMGHAVAGMERHDPRERAVRRRVAGRSVPRQRKTKEEGEGDDEQGAAAGSRGSWPAQGRPARAQPRERQEDCGKGEHAGRHGGQRAAGVAGQGRTRRGR